MVGGGFGVGGVGSGAVVGWEGEVTRKGETVNVKGLVIRLSRAHCDGCGATGDGSGGDGAGDCRGLFRGASPSLGKRRVKERGD